MVPTLIVVVALSGSFLVARLITGWRSRAELLQGSVAGAIMGIAGGLLEGDPLLALVYAALGSFFGTGLLWLAADKRERKKRELLPTSNSTLVKLGTILVWLIVAEAVLISILWIGELMPRWGLFLGMGLFAATVAGLLVTGLVLRREDTQRRQETSNPGGKETRSGP